MEEFSAMIIGRSIKEAPALRRSSWPGAEGHHDSTRAAQRNERQRRGHGDIADRLPMLAETFHWAPLNPHGPILSMKSVAPREARSAIWKGHRQIDFNGFWKRVQR